MSTSSPPLHPKPSFYIRPARFSEQYRIAEVLTAAFWDDELFGNIINPRRHEFPEDNKLYWLRQFQVNWWDWTHQYIVAVVQHEGKELVTGVALWERLGEEGRRKMAPKWWDPRSLLHPLALSLTALLSTLSPNRASTPPLTRLLQTAAPYTSHLYTGPRSESYYLASLGIDPLYQRSGQGRALVAWGMRAAASENVCASVVAGEGKVGFYRSCGFRVQEGWSGMGVGNPLGGVPGGECLWRDRGTWGEGEEGGRGEETGGKGKGVSVSVRVNEVEW
ncbi:hypothetical protein M501DRAFT_103921 [Patellaria atrata CBS 101060]|uniref:N-acetyltransferase domain-containing protein n=1 Tax=Patellaria atrata CBS 101060 TaxID=1346257 RepID=A0A9P4VW02_9PEZI|nr:hypothetical protein M501DRAFT_103921 [Patellaria atrata CBS 101060]